MKITLPQYNGADNSVMLIAVPVYSFAMNLLIFSTHYFSGGTYFLATTFFSSVVFSVQFILCGSIAVWFKSKYTLGKDLYIKQGGMIVAIFPVSVAALSVLLFFYDSVKWFEYEFNAASYLWCCLATGLVNIFLTIFMEGVDCFNAWKNAQEEAEKMNAAYKQSRLWGLKNQVNPHFLFNSLNSLSGLIQEDEEAAEKFLDEMSKVYRYMLRKDNEQWVTVNTELSFINSYMHLLTTRYGEGLQLSIDIADSDLNKFINVLALQLIIENAFTKNVVSKTRPLKISISSCTNGTLQISNTVQPKIINKDLDVDGGLDNLVKIYELLNQPVLIYDTSKEQRLILLPLLNQNQEVAI